MGPKGQSISHPCSVFHCYVLEFVLVQAVCSQPMGIYSFEIMFLLLVSMIGLSLFFFIVFYVYFIVY